MRPVMLRLVVILMLVVASAALPWDAWGSYALAPMPRCFGEMPTIVGTHQDDDLEGTKGPDVIAGLGGDDQIAGFEGDDLLCGGRGNDELNGDWGCEEAFGSDHLAGGRGHDVLGGGGCPASLGGGDDVLRGGRGRDQLMPSRGDDRVDGGLARNTFVVSAGEPARVDLNQGVTDGAEGRDSITRGSISNIVTLDCSAGGHVLIGNAQDNVIYADEGSNRISGRAGDDEIHSGNGYYGFEACEHDGGDVVHGGRGNGVIYADWGDDRIWGGRGNDVIRGEGQDDYLIGGRGTDGVNGGDDRDTCSAEGMFECERTP